MADVAVAEVIKQTVQIGANLIVQESSRLYWLKEEIKWIEREMRHIESYLKDANAKQNSDERVKCLLNDIRELASDTQDILIKFQPQMASQTRTGFLDYLKCASCLCCNCYKAHNFALEIEKIKRRVADIERVRNTYGINDRGDDASMEISKIKAMLEEITRVKRTHSVSESGEGAALDPRLPMLHVDEPYVIGLDNDSEMLQAKLLNPGIHFQAVSIVGMGGLGKTTLAKKVYKSVQRHFNCSAMVSVSQTPKMQKILKDIAGQVGLGNEEENLAAKLYSFQKERKYLLLIDDIWHTETWDALKVGIPTTSENESRIIVTSRDSGVGRYIGGEESLHALQLLDFDNSWTLFTKTIMAPWETNVPSELEDIGKQIVRRCGGLPLAIVVTGGLLKERERVEHAWKAVLECMGQDKDLCLRILALSYHDLDDNLKMCFFYLGVFPEDHIICTFDLINLWVAEGFIEPSKGRLVEDIGEDCLSYLVARNLIQIVDRNVDGRITKCRVHDLLYRFCILVGRDSNFLNTIQDLTSSSKFEKVCRVTTHGCGTNIYLYLHRQIPKLSTFVCLDDNQIVEDLREFYHGSLRFLRVLVINYGYKHSAEIPDDFGDLNHLIYLKLKGVWMGNPCGVLFLPFSISNLKNLLTLDVQDCPGARLPTSIWKLRQISHILLHRTSSFVVPSPGGCKDAEMDDSLQSEPSYPNLQTLDMINLKYLNPSYLYKFSNLRRLGISCYKPSSKQMNQVLSDAGPVLLPKLEILSLDYRGLPFPIANHILNLSRCENLREVYIHGDVLELPVFPSNLAMLTVDCASLKEDPLQTLGTLPKLKFLDLYNAYGDDMHRYHARAGSFPLLEVFKFQPITLDSGNELAVDEEAMPRLKQFIFDSSEQFQVNSKRLRSVMIISS